MIRVLLAEASGVERGSLREVIENSACSHEQEIQIVGFARNGWEAFELCGSLAPDVVLMDMVMPGWDGIQGTRLIKSKYPKIKILIITEFCSRDHILTALACGADGFILNEVSSEELISSIKGMTHSFGLIHKKTYEQIIHLIRGQSGKPGYMLPDISVTNTDMVYDGMSHPTSLLDCLPSQSLESGLTDREREIIRCIVAGKSNQEISQIFYLSQGRVKNLITGIQKKLGVKDRAQLVAYAVKVGMA